MQAGNLFSAITFLIIKNKHIFPRTKLLGVIENLNVSQLRGVGTRRVQKFTASRKTSKLSACPRFRGPISRIYESIVLGPMAKAANQGLPHASIIKDKEMWGESAKGSVLLLFAGLWRIGVYI